MYHVHTLLLHTCYRIHSLAQAYCNWSTRCSSSPTSPRFRISFWRRPFVPMPSLWTFDSKTPPIRLQFRLPTHKPQESAGACRKTNAILVFLLVAIDPDKSIAFLLTISPYTFPCGRTFARSKHASSVPRRYTMTGRSRTQTQLLGTWVRPSVHDDRRMQTQRRRNKI